MIKENFEKRRGKLMWRVYLWFSAFVGILILFLPVNAVFNQEGVARWFIFYITVAGITLVSYGALLRGWVNKSVEGEAKSRIAPQMKLRDGVAGEVEEVPLPAEDLELLYSLRELEEWFRMSCARYIKSPLMARRELERWYRLGITKEILIRNLKRRIKELEREVKRLKKTRKIEGEELTPILYS